MTLEVAILVPRRADGGHRDRLWAHSRSVWSTLLPDWPIIEGAHDDGGPFNRSAAVNAAAEEAEWADVLLVIDADVLPDPAGVREAVLHAANTGGPASGFDRRRNLSRQGTERILAGFRGSWDRYVASVHDRCISGAFAVRRDLWNEVGGFDELFVGWGFEDTAFEIACETMSGQTLIRVRADLWHMWHAKSPEKDPGRAEYVANRERRDRYAAAKAARDRAALDQLTREARTGSAVRPPRPERSIRIPRILHRTVPAVPGDEAERFWYKARPLLPGWEFYDWRDPLDPADFPETSALWGRCSSGAQMAGLVRLEVLWRHGGVYVDSDMELYRSLEPLLALEGFAAWEDDRVCPDAVLGFKPGHPAVAIMLERARAAVERGEGAWVSGPGVTTSTLPGREDVLLLPPGSFYPYHYKEKHRRGDDHMKNPWTFGAHHWAHSWAGK